VPAFVVGDVHGCFDAFVDLLRDAEFVDGDLRWSGRDARLWLLGDLVDRGPDGIAVVELVMRLEREGPVRCLLGNHDLGLLAAWRFGLVRGRRAEANPRALWQFNGGQPGDLARFRPDHAAWIERLPAVAREGDWLLVHSDTDRYMHFGLSVDEVCRTVSEAASSTDPELVDDVLAVLAGRYALQEPWAVDRLLATLGGSRIVHGHTPIPFVRGIDPELVTEPLDYGNGLVRNVDHCLFAGGPGFITELEPIGAGDEADTKSSDAAP
jgi:hypothetical protein